MNEPTRDEQKRLVRLREETCRELDRMRREALRGMPYDWEAVDTLLDLLDRAGLPSRTTSGLVEMQRWFMRAAPEGGEERPAREEQESP